MIALKTDSLLKTFCVQFERLYGAERVTPNMHMHTHLCECVLDFCPVFAFWLFSSERYNSIMGGFLSNNHSFELQLMRKFLCDQSVQEISFPDSFHSNFESLFQTAGQSGTRLHRWGIPVFYSHLCNVVQKSPRAVLFWSVAKVVLQRSL